MWKKKTFFKSLSTFTNVNGALINKIDTIYADTKVGFDQLHQAYVHIPLTSAVDKSQQHQNTFSGMLRIEPEAAG